MNILVCDENQNQVKETMNLLKNCKHDTHLNIIATSDCQELKQLIKQFKFDMAYLDMHIGDMYGIDIAKSLLKVEPQCLIIFITDDKIAVPDAFSINAFQYFFKPLIHDKFNHEFQRALENIKKNKIYIASIPPREREHFN